MPAICVENGNKPWPVDPYTREHVCNRAKHRVKVTHSGDAVRVQHAYVFDSHYDSDPERDAIRSFVRAKEKLMWKVIAMQADHLLTLTYQENVEDVELARGHMTEFWRRVRAKIKGFKLVGVAENQERGAIHWHMALHGFHDVKLLRSIWREVIGTHGLHGNIDIKFFHGKSAEAIAKYISKYLGKGFEVGDRPRYSHYYVTSRGLVFETVTYHCFGYSEAEITAFVVDLVRSLGGDIKTRWRRDGGPIEQSGGVQTW